MARPDALPARDGSFYPPGCLSCRHHDGAGGCAVFDGPIPLPILAGEHDHRDPFPGDGGRTWEPDAAHIPPGFTRAAVVEWAAGRLGVA